MEAYNEHEHHHEECGCGHHHDHEHHHEDCGCGHHHDHEHHHEECGCGHRHDHEHHHEECGCGHHHEHDHHHEECGCGHHHDHEHHHEHHDHHAPKQIPGGVTKVYILENLGCAHCAAKMEEAINDLPGVSATITFATKQLRVTAKEPDKFLPQIRKICTSIESQVEVRQRQDAKDGEDHDRQDLREIGIGAVLFVLGIVAEKLELPGLATLAIFAVGYVILSKDILLEAAKNLKNGHMLDENFLMSVASLGAFAIADYPEAVGVMLFYRVGELFEHKAVERSRSQIMEAIDLRPEVVNRLEGEQVTVIPAEEAKAGDILLIRPGDRIPVDGVVVEGTSRVDTSPITGEPVPVAVREGSSLTSGCVNQSGQLKMRVEKVLAESMVTRILDSVENAAASKPKIDRFITRFAKVYTPIVVAMAAFTAIVPSLVTGNWNYWVYTAISFLVMSCPCALVLSVPLAYFSGIGAGSKKGILFKGGVSIEALGNLKAVVMDKTGTITQGNFRLQEIHALGQLDEDTLLTICAGCEANSTHPIAVSIVSAAREREVEPVIPETMEELAGHGIVAQTSYGQVLCGNRKLLEKFHVDTVGLDSNHPGAEVYLAVNGQVAGIFRIADTVKSDARAAIARLKAMGLHTAMLTGDEESSANAVAEETGIDEVVAKLLPQEKLAALTRIRQERGAVMFVGDGINDAPVLAGADVGAAMGSGADAAIEAADAVFMKANVSAIPEAVAIARHTNRIAKQNVVFALAVKISVMILGLCGYANMWMAVFADTGVAMLCVLNSVRALYKK